MFKKWIRYEIGQRGGAFGVWRIPISIPNRKPLQLMVEVDSEGSAIIHQETIQDADCMAVDNIVEDVTAGIVAGRNAAAR